MYYECEKNLLKNFQARENRSRNICEHYTLGLNTVYARPIVKTKMITSYIQYYDYNVLKFIKDVIILK